LRATSQVAASAPGGVLAPRTLLHGRELAVLRLVRARVEERARLVPHEAAPPHDRRLGGQGEPLGEVVGDEQQRCSGLAPLGEHLGERRAARVVEPRVRLVAQQQPRSVHHRSRDRHPLLQPSAQRARRLLRAVLDSHEGERVHRCPRRLAETVQPRRQLDVLANRERTVQHARVAHQPDLRACRGALSQRHAVHVHGALARSEQAGHEPQQRGLPRPVRSEQRQAIAGAEREGHGIHDAAAAERADEPFRLDHRRRLHPSADDVRERIRQS
jgi:hypothetical protein